MACPATNPVCRVRGDTDAERFTITSDGSTPIDITGGSFLLTVDPSESPADNSNNLYQLTGIISDGPNGKVNFAPDGTQAQADPGNYFYDIQWTDSGGTVKTILKGSWEIQQDITK